MAPRTSIRARSIALAAVLLATTAACGSRMSYDEIVARNAAANGTSGTTSGAPAAASADAGPSTGAAGSSGASAPGASDGSTGTTVAGSQAAATPGSPANPSGGASPAGPATGSVVNVGQMGSNSGLLGTLLAGSTGAKAWAQWVNQHGGLGGHRVNLITVDDGGDPATGLSEVKQLVEQDKVIALIASNNVLSEPTIGPYLAQMKVPTIGGDNVVTDWFTNPMFFPTGPSTRVQTDGTIKGIIDQGYKKVAIVYCVEFSLICKNSNDAAVKDIPKLGGTVVYNASVSLAQPDFTTQCLGAKRAGADAFLLLMDPNSIIRLTGNCTNQDYHPHFAVPAIVMRSALLQSSNTNGAVGATSVFPYPMGAPETSTFQSVMRQATGAAPTSEFEALAWVAGQVLQRASQNLPANPTPADVLKGLYSIRSETFGGLTVPITYTAGQPTSSPTCYFTLSIANGAYAAPNGLKASCISADFAPVNA